MLAADIQIIYVKISNPQKTWPRLVRECRKGRKHLNKRDSRDKEAEKKVRDMGGVFATFLSQGVEENEPSEHRQAEISHTSRKLGLFCLRIHRKGSLQAYD